MSDADHLFVYDGLVYMARRNGGYSHSPRSSDIDMRRGRCDSVLLRHEKSAVRVQFMDLAEDVWRIEDGELRHSFENIQWIFGSGVSGPVDVLKARDGYVLRARCEFRDGTRQVLVRMETFESESEWIPLSECVIAAGGIVTAAPMADLHPAHRAALDAEPAEHEALAIAEAGGRLTDRALAVALEPILRDLTAAMTRDEYSVATEIRTTNQSLLNLLGTSRLEDEKQQLRRIMRWHLNHPNYRRDLAAAKKAKKAKQQETKTTAASPKSRREADRLQHEQALALVNMLEAARYRDDTDQARGLVGAHAAVADMLAQGGAADVLGARFKGVIDWLLDPSGIATSSEPARAQQDCDSSISDLTSVLRAAAIAQKRVSARELLNSSAGSIDEIVRLMVEIERARPLDSPLLTAVLTDLDGSHGIFYQVAAELGYDPGTSEFKVQLVWKTELDRVHAYFARPARPMPDSLLEHRPIRRRR